MSIQNEIIRLQNAKTGIKDSIENKGVSIPSDETLDNYSNYIDNIQTGLVPNIQIGTVTSGDTPSVTRTGTDENPVLNFVLQKGDTGATGPQGEKGDKGDTPDLTNYYTKTEVNQSQASQDENIEKNTTNIDWLQTLANQMPTVSGQGTDLSLQDVLNYRLMKFLPEGSSSQESTEGYNISNFTRLSSSGITYFGNDITIINPTTRYLYGTNYWNLVNNSDLSGKTYTFYVLANGSTGAYAWSFYVAKTGNSYAFGKTYAANSNFNNDIYVGRIALQDGEVFTNIRVESSSADNATNLNLKIMVVEGSYTADTIPPYEPYTGGIASPNPDYPQDVKSVTGENGIMVQNENLFDDNKILIGKELKNDGTIGDRAGWYVSDFIKVSPNSSYYVNGENKKNGKNNFFYDKDKNYISKYAFAQGTGTFETPNNCEYVRFNGTVAELVEVSFTKGSTAPSTYVPHEEQNYQLSLGDIELNSSPDGTIKDGIVGSSDVSYNLFNLNQFLLNAGIGTDGKIISATQNNLYYIPVKYGQSYKMSFTNTSATGNTLYGFCDEIPSIEGNCTYNVVTIANLNGCVFTPASQTNKYLCIRLNRDNQLAYLSNIQITEGSEVKPYFPYGQKGMWYKREYINKITFNGSENWEAISTDTSDLSRFMLTLENAKQSDSTYNLAYCSHLTLLESGGTWSKQGFTIANDNSLVVRIDAFPNLTDFKAWLSTTNPQLYYPLANYIDIPITDETLIEQLNDIYNNAHSYNGITNITTINQSDNEQMYLDVDALVLDCVRESDLNDYVKFDNYAGSTRGGTVKVNSNLGLTIDTSNGNLKTAIKNYNQYVDMNNNGFIGKGTLENVIVGKELVDQMTLDETQAEQDEKIELLDNLVDQLPTIEQTGTSLSLQDVLNYRLMKFLPQGSSSQFSTEGKQLFNKLTAVAGALQADGTVNTSATLMVSDYIEIDSTKQYYKTESGSVRVKLYDENKIVISTSSNSDISGFSAEGVYSIPFANAKYIRISITNELVDTLMFAQSDTATSYEPYTGGVPAPNPSYPQDIKNVTGENNVVLQNKNLLNIIGTKTHNGVTTTGTSDGKMISAGTTGSTYRYFNMTENYKPANIPAGDYIFSIQTPIAYKLQILFYDVNQTMIKDITINNGSTEANISLSSNALYYRLAMVNVGLETSVNVTIYPMLRLSIMTDGSFIPHKEQIKTLLLGNMELNSSPDGTVRDQIVGSPNEWYKREYIGKYIYNNDLSTNGVTDTRVMFLTPVLNIAPNLSGIAFSNLVMCNMLQSTIVNDTGLGGTTSTSKIRINISRTIADSYDEAKAIFSNNNLAIYYSKSQYTDIPITDTTLVSQLNDIYNNAHSYNGVTNITTTYADGNEQMYLDVSAIRQANDYVTDNELTDYVKNTDYASNSAGGVIRVSAGSATDIASNGVLRSVTRSYANYLVDGASLFISKGTLENVITGKDLTTKAYVDELVGDIETALDLINGEEA